MKNKRVIWAAVSTAALAGCAGADIRSADDGAQRPASEVAILFTPRQGVYDPKARRAHFSAADGKAVGTFMKGFPDATRIAPGTYLFKVRCFDPTLYSPRHGSQWAETFMLFQATVEAGHFYELGCDVMKAYAIDRGTRFEAVKDLLHPDAAEKLRR
jgi:hypothetical protein